MYTFIYTRGCAMVKTLYGHPAHGITNGDQAFQELCQRDLYPISEEGCLWGLPFLRLASPVVHNGMVTDS